MKYTALAALFSLAVGCTSSEGIRYTKSKYSNCYESRVAFNNCRGVINCQTSKEGCQQCICSGDPQGGGEQNHSPANKLPW